MIQEDFVSFETAKLLKEKGYKGSFKGYYNDAGCVVNRPNVLLKEPEYQYYKRASLYMAMKWLREVHNIVINIGCGEVFEDKFQWWCIILNLKDGSVLRESEYYATYEQAAEAAIKYCLENLL